MRRPLAGIAAGAVVVVAAVVGLRAAVGAARAAVAPPPIPAANGWIAPDTLQAGESLSDLFGRHGIGGVDLPRVVELLGIDPRRLPAGLVVQFGGHDSTPDAVHVTVRTRPDVETTLLRAGADWTAARRAIRWDTTLGRVAGQIETSLSEALERAESTEPMAGDERVRLAGDLADVMAWEVDFTRDLQPNDRFAVVVEHRTSALGEARLGAILAAELEVGNRRLTAYRFETRAGRFEYYDGDGVSLRRAFLRAPVEFRRVSSRFSRSRLHPILGVWRRHQGVDYAAGSGTPVLAVGDGTIQSAGWSGGYGRMIEIRHRNGITTRYAHLRGYAQGIHPGARVTQGRVVGFVGSSGLATSAHLHYEFRQNGAARDPSRIDLGNGEPVPAAEVAAFRAEHDRLRGLLFPPKPPIVAADHE